MNFFLFILATATLFIRPGEIVPAWRGVEIFMYLILPCLVLSLPQVSAQMSAKNLQSQHTTLSVLWLLAAVVASNLAHFDIETAWWLLSLKNVVYYILLVALVNTPRRFKAFAFSLWFFSLAFAVLAVSNHHGLIDLQIEATLDSYEGSQIKRMTGSGLFADPNDTCVALNLGIILSLYGMGGNFFRLPRPVYLAAALFLGYGLMQTQSRGGFIALTAALGLMLVSRYGWKKAAALGALGLPVLLFVFKGRITTISTQETTSHQRLDQWGVALEFFKSSPLLGIGANKFRELSSLVAHNSYMQAYAELGFLGGTLFTGIFYLALSALYRMGRVREEIADPDLRRAQPFVMGIVASAAALMLTVTQTYYMSTYMIFGLATAYLRVADSPKLLKDYRLNSSFVKRLVSMSILFLIGVYVFVRLFR